MVIRSLDVKPQKFQCTPCPRAAQGTVVRILQVPTRATGPALSGSGVRTAAPPWRLRLNLQKLSGALPAPRHPLGVPMAVGGRLRSSHKHWARVSSS